MAVVKCTALLRQNTGGPDAVASGTRLAGWSESWYFVGSVGSAQGAFEAGLTSWCQLRARTLPLLGYIVGQRYQIVDDNGLPQGGATVTASVYPAGTTLVCDSPSQSLLIAFPSTDNLNVRHWAMRDLPDSRQVTGEYNPIDTYAAAVKRLTDYTAARFVFRAVNHTNVKTTVLGVDNAGLVTTKTAHGLAVGQDVFLSRMTSILTGRSFSVVAPVASTPTTTTFTILNGFAALTYKGGTARRRQILFATIGTPYIERTVTRKVGRPTAEYVGRVSRRRR